MSSWVLVPAAALLVAALLASVFRKASRAPSSVELRNRLGVSARTWSVIGILEVAAVLGVAAGAVLPVVGAAAAAGVALLMVGAIVAHLRAGVSGRPLVPPTVLLAAAVLTGLGFATAL